VTHKRKRKSRESSQPRKRSGEDDSEDSEPPDDAVCGECKRPGELLRCFHCLESWRPADCRERWRYDEIKKVGKFFCNDNEVEEAFEALENEVDVLKREYGLVKQREAIYEQERDAARELLGQLQADYQKAQLEHDTARTSVRALQAENRRLVSNRRQP
jgi:hypothetical protein